MTKLVTPKEAAQILGGTKPIPLRTLAYWRKIGEGPDFISVGRNCRYPEEALYEFLAQNTNKLRSPLPVTTPTAHSGRDVNAGGEA